MDFANHSTTSSAVSGVGSLTRLSEAMQRFSAAGRAAIIRQAMSHAAAHHPQLPADDVEGRSSGVQESVTSPSPVVVCAPPPPPAYVVLDSEATGGLDGYSSASISALVSLNITSATPVAVAGGSGGSPPLHHLEAGRASSAELYRRPVSGSLRPPQARRIVAPPTSTEAAGRPADFVLSGSGTGLCAVKQHHQSSSLGSVGAGAAGRPSQAAMSLLQRRPHSGGPVNPPRLPTK